MAKEKTEKANEKKKKPGNKVKIFLSKRFKGDDVRTVSVNGRYVRIPTGKEFEVEPEFAEVIINAGLADEFAEKRREALARE